MCEEMDLNGAETANNGSDIRVLHSQHYSFNFSFKISKFNPYFSTWTLFSHVLCLSYEWQQQTPAETDLRSL